MNGQRLEPPPGWTRNLAGQLSSIPFYDPHEVIWRSVCS